VNDGSYMMLPNKYGTMIRVPREHRKSISFKKKETKMMQEYVNVGIGNYVVFSTEQLNPPKQDEESPQLMVLVLSLEQELVLFSKVLNLVSTHMLSD
jgi:hypothetical protein